MAPNSTFPLAVLEGLAGPLFAALPAPYDPARIHVEILEDAITVEGTALVRVTKLRLVPAPASVVSPVLAPGAALTAAPRASGLAALVGAKTWADIRITVLDGHTVRISCGGVSIRRTYRDLGLYAEHSREPTKKWLLLLKICAEHGTFRWSELGTFHTVRQSVSVLRAKLKAAFGIDEDPFGPFANGWKAKFFASAER